MVALVPRTLKAGDQQLVTAVITELNGADITTATFEVAHILDSQKNDDQSTYPWETPHPDSGPAADGVSVMLIRKLVTAATVNGAKTKYRVFVKVTDNPEIAAIDCGTYSVIP